jgi:hypothetical protein
MTALLMSEKPADEGVKSSTTINLFCFLLCAVTEIAFHYSVFK